MSPGTSFCYTGDLLSHRQQIVSEKIKKNNLSTSPHMAQEIIWAHGAAIL